jgi:uncharacterized membrane-anchored protein
MIRLMRLVLLAQTLFFAAWGAALLRSHRIADVVWLATIPVDPRDLLSGHYVALRYPIESPPEPGEEDGAGSPTVYVRLAPSEEAVPTREGLVRVWTAVACRRRRPDVAPGERWIVGQRGDRERVVYGIERFYVPEGSPLRRARSGDVVAKVAIAAFVPRIVDLVEVEHPAP